MKRRAMLKAAVLGAAIMLATGARGDWNATVERADGGHLIGNPDAKVTLTEYVSYTCPHCARFTREGEGALKLAYVGTGRMRLEIRHLVRDPVDLTVAVLTNCGAASRFPQNHSAFMFSQDDWIGRISAANEAQRQRWTSGAMPARLRAIASDFGFYNIMERRGYSRAETDRCLADEAAARRIAETSAQDWQIPGITGTPAFAIDGSVLAGTSTWRALETQLNARF